MSSQNCHNLSIGRATSHSFVISTGGLPLERAAAAEAAEVVGHAVPLQRIGVAPGGHGHPAHRVHHVLQSLHPSPALPASSVPARPANLSHPANLSNPANLRNP